MDFKIHIILLYLNSTQKNYSYTELMSLLKMPYEQLHSEIENLIERGYLFKGDYALIRISEKGKELLSDANLLDFNIWDLFEDTTDYENSNLNSRKAEISDIYIPKGFDKKFNGY
ncbi:hypothetical protein BK784_01360 [Bacillus thuringiensis serovar medellin]|uniref:Uncharacterized protein n=1 Tax=Bacillus thuringiensis subsp. medellin TaxID=79672 RepID=A0A9X6N804_BACTV|nr:hypothetical protein [Bacillus thuringiensis]OUC03851.1 hypothetical protein BK784_01360 [Bacillus thuringiensis serovar medellin]